MPPRFVWGSALLAARTAPPFDRCILIEKNRRNAEVLATRTQAYGDHVSVRTGDVNDDLVRVMRNDVPRQAPCFCCLHPEGLELSWQTIRSAALIPGRPRKPEFLVLFPSSWLMRLLPKKGTVDPRHAEILDGLMPARDWRDVYQLRLERKISPSEAKDRYVDLYRQGFQALGYRAFQPGGSGTLSAGRETPRTIPAHFRYRTRSRREDNGRRV